MSGPEPTRVLEAPGLACVSLTPLIKRTIKDMAPGEILEVRADDPAARVGVPAWCRLTGNPLLDTVTPPAHPNHTIFHIGTKEQ